MSNLYLRSVELTNFRIYGDSYGFEFPGGPGVILITGANGLGKTSFFDGVEWALTNQVSRFQDIQIDGRRNEQDPLTRIGANPNSHRVSLQFSDGKPIDRGLGFEPDEATIAALLKRSDWAPISNLHGYLSITHFLGQAATRRFSLRKPKEQWEALKGPAGVDRINALRERMSGQGSRQAFTRAIRERTDGLKSASEALLDWNTLIVDRDRSRHLASSDQAISPQDVAAEIDALAIRILSVAPSATWSPISGRDDAETSLHRLATLIDGVDAFERDETGRLELLAQLVVDFDIARSETAALTTLLQETEDRRAATAQMIAPAESAVSNATAAIAVLEREAAQEQHRSVVLSRVVAAVRQLDESQNLEKEAQAQLDICKATIAAVTTRLEQARIAFDNANAEVARRRALNDNLTLATKRVQISASLAELTSEILRLSALGDQKDIATLRQQRTQSVIEAQLAANNIAKLSAELREFDERLQALSQAISTIAHRIRHDDTYCPICATEFPPGHLAALARSQADGDSTLASDLASSLATAQLRVEQLNGRTASLDREIAEHDQLLATLGAIRARAASANQKLVEAGGNAESRYDGSEIAPLEAELGVLDAALSNALNPSQIKTQSDEAEAQLKAEMAKQVSIELARNRASEAVEIARSTLFQYPDFWAQAGGLLVDITTEIIASSSRLSDTGARLADAQATLRECRVELDRLREAEAMDIAGQGSIDRRLNALVVQRQALTAKWSAGGQSGEPDTSRITQQRARITERSSRIAVIRSAQERLTAGFRKWLSDNHLRDLESRIAAGLHGEGCGSEAEVAELLARNVDSAQDALAVAQRARDRMSAVGEQMTERAESFAGEVLEPLNATIKRFARTLMTWTDESITYRAEHHATSSSLRPGIVRVAPDGSTTQLEMNPNLYFSEGQLSALSVAALLAASTTFGWSRWRGLLMDDPLQHNDVIHASAFMDLLRQMVRKLGYQVILSTHDSAEAEFLARKCSSAGIPYHVHELAPRGDDGLISVAAA